MRKYLSIMILLMVTFAFVFVSDIKVKADSTSYATEYDNLSAEIKANCVYFARYKVPSLPTGLISLQDKKNIINGYTAKVGAIAITTGNSSAGHVAYVEAVDGNMVTTLNGGWKDGTHIGRWTSSESTQGIIGYWYPDGLEDNSQEINNPQGSVDSIVGNAGTITVSGWVFDKDDTSAAIEVHVYIGGPAGSGAEAHIIKADKLREDVNAAYPSAGDYHGFSETISTDKTGNLDVYIYAINIGSGSTNPELGHKTVSITPVYIPEGNVDFMAGGQGEIQISGWAFDRDSVEVGLSIHVYIDGVFQGGMKADKLRADVNTAYPGAGEYHGFDGVIETTLTGERKVEVYAINVGGGNGNSLIGSKIVTIYEKTSENSTGDEANVVPTSTPETSVGKDASNTSFVNQENRLPDVQETTLSPNASVTVPSKVVKVKAKSARKKVKISWKKVSNASGYQIQYALNKKYAKKVKSRVITKTKSTIKKLKRKKTYYVRVRAYRLVGTKKVYGKWSKSVKIKVK